MNIRDSIRRSNFRLFSIAGICIFCICCTDTAIDTSIESKPDTELLAVLNVSLYLSGSSPQTYSGDYEINGTNPENAISRLVAIVVDLDDSGNEVYNSCAYAEMLNPGASVTFRVRTGQGPKHIYLVANMSARQAVAAISGRQPVSASTWTYQSVISEFMTLGDVVSDGENRPGSNIAMSGQAIIPGQAEDPTRIVLPAPTQPQNISYISGLEVKLERSVSKVLFTCKVDRTKTGGETGASYVLIRDPQSTQLSSSPDDVNNDYNGWMNVRDVWYALNNTSRQMYVMKQTQTIGENTYVEDPNFALSKCLHRVDGVYTPITADSVYAKNFVSFAPSDLALPTRISDVPFSPSTCRMRALPYDAAKADPSDPGNHYTEGLYCLENTVSNDLPDLAPAERQSVPRMGSTYVVIGARYVPKFIYDDTVVGQDISGRSYADYATALNKLAEVSGIDRNGNATIYPKGTFFYYFDGNKSRFCTYQGMMKWIALSSATLTPVSRNDFNEYIAGWGYYLTYISGVQSTTPDIYGRRPLYFKDNDGVVRNSYYLLKALLFYVPGSNLPTEDLILVNSTRLDWMSHGKTEVVVKPK